MLPADTWVGRHSTDYRPFSVECRPCVDRHIDGLSIDTRPTCHRVSTTLDRYVGRVSIAGIDRHSTAGAFSTHDPKFLTQHHSKLNIIDMNNNYICKLRSQNLRGTLCNQMLLWRTAAFKSFTCCFVILPSKRHRSSRWGTQLRCRVRTLTPSPRGFHDKLSKCRHEPGAEIWRRLRKVWLLTWYHQV